jgi:hypothetical protein
MLLYPAASQRKFLAAAVVPYFECSAALPQIPIRLIKDSESENDLNPNLRCSAGLPLDRLRAMLRQAQDLEQRRIATLHLPPRRAALQ